MPPTRSRSCFPAAPIPRRSFIAGALGGAALPATLDPRHAAAMDSDTPNEFANAPVRTITRPPGHHWFGYYDKEQFDPGGRFALGMRVDFEHRTPEPDDVIQIGMVDLEEGDRWIPLGESRAWNWQQGCMLQWLPGSDTKVLWNDREGDRFVCRIHDTATGEEQLVPHPVYSVSPDGRTAVAPDFARIADVRPGYGYAGLPDRHADDLAPEETGIFRVDLETGSVELILSVAEVAAAGEIPQEAPGIKHYFNHLLFNPDGSRFIALHRWRYPEGNRLTRLLTAAPDGSDMRLVIPNGYASHFIWRDPQHLLSQARHWLGNEEWGNFLFEDRESGVLEEIGHGVLDPAGHFVYLPGQEWLLCDTYPTGPERHQTPHLFEIASGRRIDLGHYPSPAEYRGEWRVDTHPRLSRDAKRVCIDSAHGGQGRQMHLIEIGHLAPFA